ncbi:MAG: HD-GYP domain-containing protein [Gallionella sp.]|nr:HD-GYP domain-containing protein [Gallionella sp.]
MLKRIPIEQLCVGMYIHEFCGSWYEHPFWRNTFLLDKPEDLSEIRATGIREIWIDTSKGLDVEGGKSAKAIASEIDQTLAQANTVNKITRHVGITQEAERAINMCTQSRLAVASMFQEARMGKALNASDALPVVDEITGSVMRNSGALISLARLKDKDNYTYMHSVAVCALMVSLARQLGFDNKQIHEAGLAGLLHDIGKTMVPLEIINKPGKLTDEEFQMVKNHPTEGYKILRDSNGISDIALHVCMHHHEKVDGSGYPDRLAHTQINLYAKMGALCDVYDAITSIRPYKNGWEPAEAIRKMAEWSSGHFDQRIFHAFVKSIGIYPIGTLVRLKSFRLGVVVEQSDHSLLTPILMVFFSIEKNSRITPEMLDLSIPSCQDGIVSHEDPAHWNIHDIQELWSGLAAVPQNENYQSSPFEMAEAMR